MKKLVILMAVTLLLASCATTNHRACFLNSGPTVQCK